MKPLQRGAFLHPTYKYYGNERRFQMFVPFHQDASLSFPMFLKVVGEGVSGSKTDKKETRSHTS